MFTIGKIALAGLVLGVGPALASAHSRVGVDFGFSSPPPCPQPAFVVESRPVQRIWVEPVYRTVCDRVWREAITEDRCARVWVPDLIEDRVVGWGRHQRVEHVLIAPGHFEDRRQTVIVAPGRWEDVQRQELVAAGHWEERYVERPVYFAPPVERHHDDFGFFGHFRF